MKINNCFIINVFRDICHLFVWWAHSFCKRDSRTWLFNSWVGTSYSDSSKRMYEYVLAHHPEINAVWLTKKEQIYNQLEKANKPVIMMGTKEAKQICSKAGYVFF